MKISAFAIICLCMLGACTDLRAQAPCTAPESAQFNFWTGDWMLTWNDSLHGSNHIEKILGGCVVQENFLNPATGYTGKSWSAYNIAMKQWQQTWVDNQGGFIYLEGGMHVDSMILLTAEYSVPASVSPTGQLVNRMVYYNITPSSFDWSWQASSDHGASWKTNWLIHYKRKSALD